MGYTTKNYRKQGGDEWVVGGKLTVGGEVDIESGGALKIAGAQVTSSAAALDAAAGFIDVLEVTPEQLNVGLALIGVMVGGYAAADHEDDTSEAAIEVLPANGEGDGNRAILVIVKCTETLAADGNLPIFELGDGATSNAFGKIGHGGAPATFAKGAIAVFAGTLTEQRPVEITVTDGATGNQAGAIQVFVIALPAATE